MYLGNLAFERPTAPDEFKWKSFGKLWYDEQNVRAALLLTGVRLGMFICKPFANVANPPYISGDITIQTGEWLSHGVVKKDYQWCGHIQSSQDGEGNVLYWGVLEVDPMPAVLATKLTTMVNDVIAKRDVGKQSGVFINIFLDEKARNSYMQQTTDDDPNERADFEEPVHDPDAAIPEVVEEEKLPF